MRRISSFLICLLFSLPLTLHASSLGDLFQKAKDQFRIAAYSDALATLDRLDKESRRSAYEKERVALLPGLAFYRGASLAAMGRKEESRGQFEAFLTHQPAATLDPAIYPKKVVAALEAARRSLWKKKEIPQDSGSLAEAYRAFPRPDAQGAGSPGEEWAQGPVRFFLTGAARQEFSRLFDPVSRSEFITQFWKARDPKPETPENEFREEFEKRVAFADARFTQEETAGSLTDRGLVFILLGPPTWVGRKPITTGEDASDHAGLSLYNRHDFQAAKAAGGSTSQQASRMDRMNAPSSNILDSSANWREIWHYRKELLPSGTRYQQVDFEFLTKQGYGKNVLQREAQILDTIERAKEKVRTDRAS